MQLSNMYIIFELTFVTMVHVFVRLTIILYVDFTLSIVQQAAQPNVLLILTDDQDLELHGMYPLQKTARLFSKMGTQFTNAFTSTPICCPARASILTGQYAHNHRTFNNSNTGGCNGHLWREIFEPLALPVLMQEHGYQTFFAGKYLNQYRGAYVPPGWDDFHGLHGNSRYYNYTLHENKQNVSYTDTYLTDLLKDKAVTFLRKRVEKQHPKPFFAMISTPAAHAPFIPAPRHRDFFSQVQALRTPSFNTPAPDKHWLVGSAHHLSMDSVFTIDKYFRRRWETLLAVDEMIEDLVSELNDTQCLNNTYIIFTSDNGYHLGQFAQPFDKRQPYETDIKVPLLIFGPDVPAGLITGITVSLIDLAPTILEWAGGSIPKFIDGRSLRNQMSHDNSLQRPVLVEYWGEGNDDTYNFRCPGQRSDHLAECCLDADCHCQDAWNNTFTCVRDFRYSLNRIYCEFRDTQNFVEAYDVSQDPHQLKNIVNDLLPIEIAFYKALLQNLTQCSGDACHI